jgi:hypothetical protein
MKTRLILLAAAAVLSSGGAVIAGPGLDALRSEILAARTALENEPVVTSEAAQMMFDAGGLFTSAIEILDEGDPVGAKRALGRISRALKLLKKAAKKEKSAEFDAFVTDRGRRLWIAATSLYEGDKDPTVGDDAQSDLERRYYKRMRRPGKAAREEKYATAFKKMKGAWTALLKLDSDP